MLPSKQHAHAAGSSCPVCERATQGKPMTLSPLLTFREAFDGWIAGRILTQQGPWTNARYISPRTERDLRQYARAVEKFFRALPLAAIHAGHLREYQRARALNEGGWKQRAGANLIRKEVETLVRVMKVAEAWSEEIERAWEPLQPAENDLPQALTPAEQHRWLHTAGSRPAWRLIYCWSLVGFQTTAATNEMRSLRIADLSLESGTIQIPATGAKCRGRVRTIPLMTPELVWALDQLLARARRKGSKLPHHYLFPLHVTQERYDPEQPMSVWGLRKKWDEVRAAANLPRFTPYDTRHTALTRMAEAGVPLPVAMSFAGHLSPKMQQRYVAISMASKRDWAAKAFQNVAWNGETAPSWNAVAAGLKKPPQSAGGGEGWAVGW